MQVELCGRDYQDCRELQGESGSWMTNDFGWAQRHGVQISGGCGDGVLGKGKGMQSTCKIATIGLIYPIGLVSFLLSCQS